MIATRKLTKKRPLGTVFSVTSARAFVAEALARPFVHPHALRVEARGKLIASFVLPLECCPTTNTTRHGQAWKHAKLKQRSFQMMIAQCRARVEPLPGRPHIRCIRFSSVEPDAYNDGFKVAIDHLRAPRMVRGKMRLGLGFIADDSPKFCRIDQHWEPAPKGRGVCLLEVWSGETE